MKIQFVNLSKSPVKKLYYSSYEDYFKKFNKGWSFSYTYSLIELRNIYIYLKKYDFKNLEDFTKKCIKENLYYEKTPWVPRRILEQINSLKNFGIITQNEKVKDENLFVSSPNEPLTKDDIEVFKKIYFSYYRFCEIHSWLISPDCYDEGLIETLSEKFVIDYSKPIFPFRSKTRFVDSFIFELENNTTIYEIANFDTKDSEGIKRFWDVYVKWGVSLGLAERFNLSDFNYQFSINDNSPSFFYFHKNIDKNFQLVDFLFDNFREKYLYIPKLVFSLARKYRFPIEDIKRLIIDAARENPDKVSLQKTSETLMKKTELKTIPKSNGFLFSHILLLR